MPAIIAPNLSPCYNHLQRCIWLSLICGSLSLSLSLVFPLFLWSSYPYRKSLLSQPFNLLTASPPVILFPLPLIFQSYLPQSFPFSLSADNFVSYFTEIRSNKKRTSSFSVHWSTYRTVSLPVYSPFPAVLSDKLFIFLPKPNASSCELVLSMAHTLKDTTLQQAAITVGINQNSMTHLNIINFQFPLHALHTLCIPSLHSDYLLPYRLHFPLACQLK